jgi:tryptophan synthase alpha chain
VNFYNQRNRQTWEYIKKHQEALLIGYLIAGDTTPEKSLKLIENAVLAGLDILELGIPSKNPYLDGPIIQAGHARVNQNLDHWLLPFWKEVRQRIQIPIWAMSYQADLFQSDIYEQLVTNRLIDALLVPDCSPEEREQLAIEIKDYGVDVVQFVQPNMSDQEINNISRHAPILYAQTHTGATGTSSSTLNNLPAFYERIKGQTSALTVAGFGIKTPENVRTVIESHFDGVVVGSALVECCIEDRQDKLYERIAEMKSQTDLYKV